MIPMKTTPKGCGAGHRVCRKRGVTAFCPTTVTDEDTTLLAALVTFWRMKVTRARKFSVSTWKGRFLARYGRGAQPEKQIRPASVSEFQAFECAAHVGALSPSASRRKKMDFALTRYCAQKDRGQYGPFGCLLRAGGGSRSQRCQKCYPCIQWDGEICQPGTGAFSAALCLDGLYGEVIADGIFVSLVSASNLYRIKNDDDVIMISDSMKAKGCPPGRYMFGGEPMILGEDGATRRENGVLVGSTLKLNRGLYNMVEGAMAIFGAALKSCTINPARLLGLDNHKGKLQRGFDADIVVLEDNYQVNTTYCKVGVIAYSVN